MALTVTALPVPAFNGLGVAVDIHLLDAQKSFALDGTLGPSETLVVEVTEDPAGLIGFTGLVQWDAGNLRNVTINVVAAFARIRRVGSIPGLTTPTASVAATQVGVNAYFNIPVPALAAGTSGVGASVDVSGGGQEASFSIHEGVGFGGSEALALEGSNDNVSFVGLLGFTSKQVPGFFPLSYKFLRIRRLNSSGAAMSFFAGTTSSGAGGGAFPGFGGAPPAVASASIAGATGLAADSGHTHAQDLSVNYTPSLAPLQGTGLVTQTGFALGVATMGLTAIPTAFPGFGGAPPSIATASAAGAAGTASRSDHTHGLDLVTYTPSAAGMKAAGVIQQTFPNPTAVPVVTVMTARNIGYGAAAGTGLLTPSAQVLVDVQTVPVTYNQLIVSSGTTPGAGTQDGILCVIDDAIAGTGSVFKSIITLNPLRMQHANGTLAAPTIVALGNEIGQWRAEGFDGAAYFASYITAMFVDRVAAIGASNVPINLVFKTAAGAGAGSGNNAQQMFGYAGDSVLGFLSITTNAVHGFAWLRTTAGVPTGVPVIPQNSVGTPTTATPMVWDSTNNNLYANYGAAWHFQHFTDYVSTTSRIPFGGATTGSFTDSDTMTFAVTATHGLLTLGTAVVDHDGALYINAQNHGPSIGGGATTGIYVVDANAAGAANIACDTNFFGQRLIGFQGGVLQDLSVGVATGKVLHVSYLMDRVGAATDAATMSGTTGAMAWGLTASATFNVGQVNFEAIQVVPNAAGGDVMLGWNGGLVAGSTHGYPYLPSLPARPTGAPNAFAGGLAFAADLTTVGGHALYIRNPVGAQWEPIPTFISTAAAGAGLALFGNAPGAIVSLNAKWWTFKDSTGVVTYIPYFQ